MTAPEAAAETGAWPRRTRLALRAAGLATLAGTLHVAVRGDAVPADAAAVLAAALVLGGAQVPGMARGEARRFGTREVAFASAGLLGAALLVLGPETWPLAMLVCALLALWESLLDGADAGSGRRRLVDAALLLGPSAVLAAVLAAVGVAGTLVAYASAAMPLHPAIWLLHVVVLTLALALVADGARERPSAARSIAGALLGLTTVVAAARAARLASLVTLPEETQWSEGPFLVNALKLEVGEPLYGAPERLDAYTYSPLADLAHRAVLNPIGLELSLLANRVVALGWQLGGGALIAWALWPHLRAHAPAMLPLVARAWLAIAACLIALSSMLAATVHPDHGVLFTIGVALALLLREPAWPRWLWWATLVLLPPLAVSFKLTGAGVWLGLALSAIVERRRPMLLALGASAALCAATVPLFEATLGRFGFWAIQVQLGRPTLLAQLAGLPATGFGLLAIGAVSLTLAWRWLERRSPAPRPDGELQLASRRAGLLALALSAAFVPSYAKYAARDNTLFPAAVGVAAWLLLRGARHQDACAAPSHPALAPLALLLGSLVLAPVAGPVPASVRDGAARDRRLVVDQLAADRAAGRTTLLLVHAAAWIEAGRREVPRDRVPAALELFYAGRPEAELLFERIAEGRYDTVIATGQSLRAGVEAPSPRSRAVFVERLRRALLGRYQVVRPLDAAGSPADVSGAVVFQRR